MIKKLIHFTQPQVEQIQSDADKNGISFAEMLRRILDEYMESKNAI
jgi:hypothetical protein